MERVEENSFAPIRVLQETKNSTVWLLSNARGKKFVLKKYNYDSAPFKREKSFLLEIQNHPFSVLHLPTVVEAGENYLILEFVSREYLTRETIFEREWPDGDVQLWVQGLREFQDLRPNRKTVPFKMRLLGFVYPIFRIAEQLTRYEHKLTMRGKTIIARLLISYLILRPFLKNVCTHYDLQTYNYSFMLGRRRMSMLDFEFSYYLGDPYFDILYYITIPPVRIMDWTFQHRLLKKFLYEVESQPRYNVGRSSRIRLILLSCNLARYLYFKEDSERQKVYFENIQYLLSKDGFSAFTSQITG